MGLAGALLVLGTPAHAANSTLATVRAVVEKLPAPPRSMAEARRKCRAGKNTAVRPLRARIQRSAAALERAQKRSRGRHVTGLGVSKEVDEAHNEVANLLAALAGSTQMFQGALTAERAKRDKALHRLDRRADPEQNRCKGDATCEDAVQDNFRERELEVVDEYLEAVARHWEELRASFRRQAASARLLVNRLRASRKRSLVSEARTAEAALLAQLELLASEADQGCADALAAQKR